MKGTQSVKRGWKAFDRGEVALAEAEFSKAVGQAPDAAFASLQLGLFQLRQDRFAEAALSFQAAAEKEVKNPAPLFFLALSRELQGETEQADAALERLTAECPRHQALASLRLLRELRRGDPLPVLHLLGFGEVEKPSSSWRTAIAGLGKGDPEWLQPDLSSSRYLLGPILVEVERKLLPREIPSLEHRQGNLLAELLELKRPQRKFIEELKDLPNSLRAGSSLRKGQRLLNRSWKIEDLDDQRKVLEQAILALEEGIKLDPYAFRAAFNLGEANLFSAKAPPGTPYLRDFLLQAERRFTDSVQMDGINPYVMIYHAFVQQHLGRPGQAIECYEKGTEKFTKMPDAHYGMGQCYLLLDQPLKAREFLLRAADSDLMLARDRLNLFANLLRAEGAGAFSKPLPTFPAEPEPGMQESVGESLDSPTVSDVPSPADVPSAVNEQSSEPSEVVAPATPEPSPPEDETPPTPAAS